MDSDSIFNELTNMKFNDFNTRDGKLFGYSYAVDTDLVDLISRVNTLYAQDNALDTKFFPSAGKVEKEVIDLTVEYLNLDDYVGGTFTSGGTESIILTVLSWRSTCEARGVTAFVSINEFTHPAWIKACDLLKVDYSTTELPSNSDRVLLVVSAPRYGTGIVETPQDYWDDYTIAIDAAIGFTLPHIPRFSNLFNHPSVEYLITDYHKLGMSTKGSSVVMFRSDISQQSSVFEFKEWNGYSITNTTITNTKSSAPIAATWAALKYLGKQGYSSIALQSHSAAIEVYNRLDKTYYEVIKPDTNLLCIIPLYADAAVVATIMKLEGSWGLQVQSECPNLSNSLHLTITPLNFPHIQQLIEDFKRVATRYTY
jgi:glutamate/tyrosine decarboxylase-like PLP-dependent enzyme